MKKIVWLLIVVGVFGTAYLTLMGWAVGQGLTQSVSGGIKGALFGLGTAVFCMFFGTLGGRYKA